MSGSQGTSPEQTDAAVVQAYHRAYNAVVQPDKVLVLTHYYIDRWLPELGENGHRIVTVLRRLGYYDRKKGIKREGIDIDQTELSKLCGMSLRTLQREFGSDPASGAPRNPALHQFVQREKQIRRNRAGHIFSEKTIYVIQMDEPLHPGDQAILDEEIQRRQKGNLPTRQNDASVSGPTRQNDVPVRQSDAPTRQNDAPSRQNGGSYKEIQDSKDLKDSEDSSSLSLFPEPELPKTCAVALKLDAMTSPPSRFDADWMRKKLTADGVGALIDADPRVLPAIQRNWEKLPGSIQTEMQNILLKEWVDVE